MTNIHNPLNSQKLPTPTSWECGCRVLKIASCCLGATASLGDTEKIGIKGTGLPLNSGV
ncbi:hypothetical protein I79_017857 [Cricetulus griseus]|uniref:Uncharacterized protein n=1 Tax=Cricetulus griseus TaxID=10029 RepID=G3I356_CRIGR|nr:hypothetical protein I79_017857 [Cricetulus griseus]